MKVADQIDAYLGSRVRLRRMTLGMRQDELGDALGLTFQQIQKYERGQNRISAGRLYRIAQLLSVPVSYFFDGLPTPDDDPGEPSLIERDIQVQEFLASPEGYAVALAFQRIDDVSTRRRLAELIDTIAKQPELAAE